MLFTNISPNKEWAHAHASGRQRRAVRTCHRSHGRRHTMFVFSPLPSMVVLEDANSTLDFECELSRKFFFISAEILTG